LRHATGGDSCSFSQRRHLPLRVRLFIDLLKENYGRPDYWNKAE